MELKEARLSLRIGTEEKKLIQKYCIDINTSIAEYLTSLAISDIKQPKNNIKMNIEVGKIENSINCLKKMLEAGKESDITNSIILTAFNDLEEEIKTLKKDLKERKLVD